MFTASNKKRQASLHNNSVGSGAVGGSIYLINTGVKAWTGISLNTHLFPNLNWQYSIYAHLYLYGTYPTVTINFIFYFLQKKIYLFTDRKSKKTFFFYKVNNKKKNQPKIFMFNCSAGISSHCSLFKVGYIIYCFLCLFYSSKRCTSACATQWILLCYTHSSS